VLAAASLTEAFTEVSSVFTKETGTRVTASFGASSTLVTQIIQGAPADVFASADTATMTRLVDAGQTASMPVNFATNRLQIIVEAKNPKAINGLADLARGDVLYVTANPDVPIGKYAKSALDKAGVNVTPRSLEADVKALVTKVTLGEADAAIVYATDVVAAGTRASGVLIPDGLNVPAVYPVVVTKSAKDAALAATFVTFLNSDRGREILAKHGFGKP
jgi:molybdate transport system substrate-binding protein